MPFDYSNIFITEYKWRKTSTPTQNTRRCSYVYSTKFTDIIVTLQKCYLYIKPTLAHNSQGNELKTEQADHDK